MHARQIWTSDCGDGGAGYVLVHDTDACVESAIEHYDGEIGHVMAASEMSAPPASERTCDTCAEPLF